ncbi:MAG: hypothetical protein ABIT83_07110 [Massilia sp.]
MDTIRLGGKMLPLVAMLALLSALGGCATLSDTTQQQLTVHAIAQNREVAGVGCILSNKAGRWFVLAPGRVTIQKSAGDLAIDCKKDGLGAANEVVSSRFDTGKMIGNVIISGGLGYLADKRSGAGFDYPSTLTVLLQAAPAAVEEAPVNATVMF